MRHLILFVVSLFVLVKLASVKSIDHPGIIQGKVSLDVLFIPQLVIGLILLVFIFTQFKLYTLDTSALAAYGLTHSQRTREVFAQLSIVSFIVFWLAFYSLNKKENGKSWLPLILLGEGMVLITFGLVSDLSYIQEFGFTHKRLWGILLALYLYSVFVCAFLTHFKGWSKTKLLHMGSILLGVTILLANLLHFDFLIYHYHPASLPTGRDYFYDSRLSPDSYSYASQLEHFNSICIQKRCSEEDRYAYRNLLYRASAIKRYYMPFNIRNFNLSEYLTYKSIKSIDVEALKLYLDNQPF